MIDRSSATGLDLILGLATLASIDRLITRGSDRVAGLWAALAFLAGGWPALVVIGLAIIVIGRTTAKFSRALLVPTLATAILWSFWTVWASSAEVWAASLTLPLTQKPAWMLGPQVVALGLPWSPFAILLVSRSVRDGWRSDGRSWLIGWLQVSLASLIIGTLVPGLSQVSRVVALAGLLVGTAACLESARVRTLVVPAGRAFFIVFGCVVGVWLIVMLFGSYVWNLAMPFYRPLGIIMSIVAIGVTGLGWSAIETRNTRRGLATLLVIAVGLKLVHWGYYVPEWNYRYSQGPWGRDRSVGAQEMANLHFPRLAARPGLLHEAARAAVAQSSLSGIPDRSTQQVFVAASLGIRELAQVCASHHPGRETSRSIGGRAHLGSYRRPPSPPLEAQIRRA